MEQVKERGVAFIGSMVNAILDGIKTNTRRPLSKLHAELIDAHNVVRDDPVLLAMCPHGKVGDRLWVREAWRVSKRWDDAPPRDLPVHGLSVFYEAGGSCANYQDGAGLKWTHDRSYPPSKLDFAGRYRPPMFLPRWASRILLEITEVRIERVADISEEDAAAEGVARWAEGALSPDSCREFTAAQKFVYLWDQIHGVGAFDRDAWVWVIVFKRITP